MNMPEFLDFNGLQQGDGSYLLPGMTTLELGELSRRVRFDDLMALIVGIDPHDLKEAGWGVIFEENVDPQIKDALSPLLEQRERESGSKYRELTYQRGWSKSDFLVHYGTAPGTVDDLPYYLLIVGAPTDIPFSFQYQLAVQYAVGRLDFDRPDDFARYAASVREVETERLQRARRASFFAVENADDRATWQSTRYLVDPLVTKLRADATTWQIDRLAGADATKRRFADVLGTNREGPALVFTTSHGLSFRNGHPLQMRHQGALVCREWPGPKAWRGKPIPEDFYFSADDVNPDADLRGLMAFHFACYGGGTPSLDAFSFRKPNQPPQEIAPIPFVAQLPQRLLANRKGAALAVIGHVERAWGWSFLWEGGGGAQIRTFEDTLKRLLLGWRVGAAIGPMTLRYAELSTDFAELIETEHIEEARRSRPRTERRLVPGRRQRPAPRPLQRQRDTEEAVRRRGRLWTARNDARSYIVLGDPAVRLLEPADA